MKIPVLILCCLVVGVSSAETAKRQMWAWKDANGVTQYSDRPVPGAKLIEIAKIPLAAIDSDRTRTERRRMA